MKELERNLRLFPLGLALLAFTTVAQAQTLQTPGRLAVYYGFPSSVNGTFDANAAADVFDDYDLVVFADPLQFPQPTPGGGTGEEELYGCDQNRHPDHDNTEQIIGLLTAAGTQVYGYVSLGGDLTNRICNDVRSPLSFVDTTAINLDDPLGIRGDIVSRVDRWADMGVTGIFLDEAGYDFGTDRARQNQTIDYIHDVKDLPVFVNAWNPDDVYSPEVAPLNPDGLASHLEARDLFLLESFAVIQGNYQAADFWQDRSDKMWYYRQAFGTQVATVTTTRNETCDPGGFMPADQAQLDYAWWATFLYGFDYMGWGEGKDYSTSGSCNGSLPFRQRPEPIGIGQAVLPIAVGHDLNRHVRTTTTGTIEVDAENHTGQFIPGFPPDDSDPCVAAPAGLLNWWPAEGDAADIVNGHDGSLTPTTSWFVDGKVGQAFSFDGFDDLIPLGNGPAVTGTGGFTVEAWIKTNGDGILVQQRDGSPLGYDGQYILSVGGLTDFAQDPGKVCWGTFADGAYGFNFCGTARVDDGVFHHVAAVREDDGTGRIYIDGILDQSEAAAPRTLKTLDVYLGADPRNADRRHFSGLIDELSIAGRALSAGEIQSIYDAGAGGKCRDPQESGDLVSHWRFDDGVGTTAADSQDGNTGTLVNGPVWTSGIVGGALHFDGVDDYVRMEVNPNLQFGTGDVTLEAWIKSDKLEAPGPSGPEVIAGQKFGYPMYFIYLASNGGLGARIGFSTSENYIAAANGPALTDGDWHHVAAVFDRDGFMTRYVDGTAYGTPLDISASSGSSLDMPDPFFRRFRVGASGETATLTELFEGLIDEVAVYGRALTPFEIQQRYQRGTAGMTPTGTDVVVQPVDATTEISPVMLTFSHVAEGGGGVTTVTSNSSGPPPPAGFSLGDPATYYDLTTTAVFSGAVTLCINYSGVSYADEGSLKLYHFEDADWVDVTTSLDTAGDVICGDVTSFSPFAVFEAPNAAPVVGGITAPVDPLDVADASISVNADFTDTGTLDTHAAAWAWGDGSASAGTVAEAGGAGTVTGDHTYTDPGVYTVTLTVTDADDAEGESIFQYVVVYDPEGGFVTGGGWITSPPGACRFDACTEQTTGKAHFGFISKYKKGQSTPTGQTEFEFKAGDLNFHSATYDWLVVSHHKAKYKGTGTINGAGSYGFLLSAIDEALTPSTDVDLFRIKLWDKDDGDAVVYDNQMGAGDDADPATALGGGNIKIHDGTGGGPAKAGDGEAPASAEVPERYELHQNYPNPFNPTTAISFGLPEAGRVELVVYDVMGRRVATLIDGALSAGRHKVTWEAGGLPTGVYFYRITAGPFRETKRMILMK